MSRKNAVALLTVCVVCTAACSKTNPPAVPTAEEPRSSTERAVVPTSASDDVRLERAIQTALARDRMLERRRILVEASEGVINLSGQVSSDAEKARAATIAAGVRGVVSVKNQLRVTPPGPRTRTTVRSRVQVVRSPLTRTTPRGQSQSRRSVG